MTSRQLFSGDDAILPQIEVIGYDRFNQAGNLSPHIHSDHFEICLIERGEVDWFVHDEIYNIQSNSVFITRPGEWHGGVGAVMHPCQLYWILVKPWRKAYSMIEDLSDLKQRCFKSNPRINDAFKALKNEHEQPSPWSQQVAEAELIRLLAGVIQASQTSHSHMINQVTPSKLDANEHDYSVSPAIHRAMKHIEKQLQFTEPIRVPDIAKRSGLSTTRFHERFRNEVGLSPADWLARQRVNRGKSMLRQGDYDITTIAYRCGFQSSQYFATVFKRYTGMTPTAYRQQARLNPNELCDSQSSQYSCA